VQNAARLSFPGTSVFAVDAVDAVESTMGQASHSRGIFACDGSSCRAGLALRWVEFLFLRSSIGQGSFRCVKIIPATHMQTRKKNQSDRAFK